MRIFLRAIENDLILRSAAGRLPGRASRRARPSPAAQHGDVVGHPAIVGHAGLLGIALGHRRAPEADLLEVAEAVGGAAFVAQQRIALAGIEDRKSTRLNS